MEKTDRLPKKFEIRDLRNGDWAWVYKAVISDPHITAQDVRTYSVLATFDSDKHEIFPSYETISEKARLSRRTVIDSIKNLVNVGYIKIEKGSGRGISNSYDLMKMPKGCKSCTLSERVQTTTEKSANDDIKRVQETTLYQKEEIKKSIDTTQGVGTSPIVIDLFKEINPSYKLLFKRKSQHEAANRLLEREGLDRLQNILKFLYVRRSDKYCPQISSPYQLEEKWAALEKYAIGLKSEKISNIASIAFV